MKRVFHFSGGRTSGMMVMKNYQPGDIVIFCDTTREDDDTYRFVKDFEKYTGIKIVWLTGDWRREVIKAEKMIPNKFKRKCTINLKIKKARRYLRSIGWFRYTQFVGFRADEPNRVREYKTGWKAVTTVFPLHQDGITKSMVNNFWEPYSWKLQIPSILSNCDLCFLKGYSAIMAIIKDCPSKADKWIEDEENKELNPKGYTYHPKMTMRQLRDKALSDTGTLFPLEDITPMFNCSCTA
jgi:hypothetical protein